MIAKIGVVYISQNGSIKLLTIYIARFASSDKYIEAATLVISDMPDSFPDTVSSDSHAGFVNMRCRLIGCDGVIDIEPLVCTTGRLMQSLSRNRNGLAVKNRIPDLH